MAAYENPMLPALASLLYVALLPPAQASLIAEVRSAIFTGTKDDAAETTLLGHAKVYGVDAKYTLRFGPDGRLLQRFESVLGETYGCDGTRIWKTNHDGVTRIETFEDLDEFLGQTLLLTDRWLDPKSGATLTARGKTIRLRLPGGLDETVLIDSNSHLPLTATFTQSAGPVKVALSDWRAVGGRKVPFHARVDLTDEVRVYDVDRATTGEMANKSVYEVPIQRPSDATFAGGVPAELEVERAPSGHLLVHPQVNGQDVGWFIFDTGAESMCIDPKVANQLGLAKVGSLPVTGVGGTVTGTFRPVKSFRLGPATIRDVYFVEIDLASLSEYFKRKIAGIVGDEYLDRCIVELNVAKPSLSIYNPAKFQLPAPAAWTPMRFESGNPLVEAKADGRLTAWYRLDTGDPNTVTFHAPYVKREHLLDGRATDGAFSGGVGGAVEARQGKIKQFELGGHRFDNLDATFSLAGQGAFADMYVAGNIGQALMRPFTLVFDYANSRVAFLPK